MGNDLVNLLILTGIYLTIFFLTELFYIKFKPEAEYTRKFIHISCGLVTMSFPAVFQSHWTVLIIILSFTALLYISKKYNFLNAINGIDRESKGSVIFPIVIYISFLVFDILNDKIYFYLPLLIMFICDPVAALIGKKFNYKKYYNGADYKTLSGSIAFFIVADIISFALIYWLKNYSTIKILFFSILISLITTITEAFSRYGTDNLLIPISAIILLYFLF